MTAENLAESHQITRAEQDALAVESHRRAARAIAEAGDSSRRSCRSRIKTRKGETVFDTDEHVRADAEAETWRKLRAGVPKDGTVTAGQCLGDQRRRRGGGADGGGQRPRSAGRSRWRAWWPMRMPGSIPR